MASSFNNASFAAKDLLLILPRLARKALYFPDAVEDIRDMVRNGGSVIASATQNATNTSSFIADKTAAASWTQGMQESLFGRVLQGIGKVKNLGGVFSYLTSRWALATFTAAIILNRAQFYASSREHLRLRWYTRLAIYLLPLIAFSIQMLSILQALRCQTSPDFAQLRYGEDDPKELPIDLGGEGGFLYKASSALLWWLDDASCCAARKMSGDPMALKGSMSLLFGFFITLCASQLFETLACALQGRQPVPETGMTLFEHSLAFAECEAMISSALGLGFFGLPSFNSGPQSDLLFTRNDIIQRLNVPPEVLLVCLISCFSHLSSALLAITGLRDKVRLVNTGVWACCYMAAFLWSFLRVFTSPIQNVADLGVLRFPTVCIVGFIPHVLILAGILICGGIYGSALLLTAMSVPESAGMTTFRERLHWAYGNLQANVQFSQSSAIRIQMSEDFYTTILKVGFNVLTAASEAVYLNEGIRIQIARSTWIERKRLDEISADFRPHIPAELLGDEIRGVEFVEHASRKNKSPYSRERRSKPRTGDMHAIEIDSGLGLSQRRSRMQLTFDFIASLFWLLVSTPAWLLRAAGNDDKSAKARPRSRQGPPQHAEALLDEIDESDDYEPSSIDDDITSVVSSVDDEGEWSDVGSRTPTRADPYGVREGTPFSRESTPASEGGLEYLSDLLNPVNSEAREQARLLSYSLRSTKQPLTRARLRRVVAEERSKLVWRNEQHDHTFADEQELESFILEQRGKAKAGATSWSSGAEGMGEGGPQCVVCQSTPRTILVWPCGCLSMCDDCRVGLAARNFTQCVCCRTDIAAYSRLYVP